MPTKAKKADEREIIYPKLDVTVHVGEDALTAQQAKELLGYETEPEYTERMLKANPKAKESTLKFGGEYLFKNLAGEKVRCWNNDSNRPFDEAWSSQLAQDVLSGNWKLNGETIIISKTGLTASGQHRLIGLVKAEEQWRDGPRRDWWQELNPKPPVIETIIVFGVEEGAEVTRTLDNVKPRTLADVFYTSDIFRKLKSQERKECARMLDTAVDLLWKRTGVKQYSKVKYQTHSESTAWLERHKTLLDCVKHLFEENSDRQLSNLHLSAGECAALMYLMASGNSDGDTYRNMEVPSEKKLDWALWDQAEEFFTLLAGGAEELSPIRNALAGLANAQTGKGVGSRGERTGILIKAWAKFAEKQNVTEDDLELEYNVDENGFRHLNDFPTCGGIDLGEGKPEGEEVDDPTPDELKARKEEEKEQKLAKKREQGSRKGSAQALRDKQRAEAEAADRAKEEDGEESEDSEPEGEDESEFPQDEEEEYVETE